MTFEQFAYIACVAVLIMAYVDMKRTARHDKDDKRRLHPGE